MSEATQTELETRGERKVRRSRSQRQMDKTVVVAVEDRFKHPMYGKVAPHLTAEGMTRTTPVAPVTACC